MASRLFYLSTIRTDSIPIFVNNWAGVFPYDNQALYEDLMSSKNHTIESIQQLFAWKFNIRRLDSKQSYFDVIARNMDHINRGMNNPGINVRLLLSNFELPGEWKIFLLHIINPEEFPLLTKYTLTAFAHITDSDVGSFIRKRKEKFYLETFVAFIRKEFYDIPMFKTDQALYAFGKFLCKGLD